MKSLKEVLRLNKTLRVVGFDDAPFQKERGSPVHISGVVCAGTRFEGMLWGVAHKDGVDATHVIATLLESSKFYEQVHLVLIDGIAVGGFNIIDLCALADRLHRPCISVMRRQPDFERIDCALEVFDDAPHRRALIARAGKVHVCEPFFFQVQGADVEDVAIALHKITDQGHVPEALRLAHLIGSAIKTGESSHRA